MIGFVFSDESEADILHKKVKGRKTGELISQILHYVIQDHR